jgi:hypothetical protein
MRPTQVQIKECMCPYCSGFRYKLEAWQSFRSALKCTESCFCAPCQDPGSPWRQASKSPSDYRAAMTCGKVAHPGLELPSSPDVTPSFVRLECSLLPKTRKVGGTNEPYTYPEHTNLCTECGWDAVAPPNCPVDMSDKPVTWTEKQEGKGPNGEAVYCDKTGTRRELLEAIRREGRKVSSLYVPTAQWRARRVWSARHTSHSRLNAPHHAVYVPHVAQPVADSSDQPRLRDIRRREGDRDRHRLQRCVPGTFP